MTAAALSEAAAEVDTPGELFVPDLPYRVRFLTLFSDKQLFGYKIGHGFDLHRLAEGYSLIIGGIDIPHTKGCQAHSDGMEWFGVYTSTA